MKTIVTSIAAGSLLAALAVAQPQPRYTVIDLGARVARIASALASTPRVMLPAPLRHPPRRMASPQPPPYGARRKTTWL